MTRSSLATLASVLCSMLYHSQDTTAADGYGSLSGQVVVDGKPDLFLALELKPKILKGDKEARDAQCCAVQDVPNDELIVNKKNGGLQNVFVYLQKVDRKSVHRSLRRSKKKEIVFDQKACRFTPHALFLRTDQKVVVKSADNIQHNTHTVPVLNQPVNFIVGANDRIGIKMPVPIPEPIPMKVKCDIHPWMKAWWLVLDHPYAAISDKDGRFKIDMLPAGDLEIVVWHERAYYIHKKLKVTIKDGETTKLDVIKVDPKQFEIRDDEKKVAKK